MSIKKVVSLVAGLSKMLNYVSMALIFLVAVIMFLDILLRLTIDVSILGTYEITEMGMTVIIFGALAQTQLLKGHVRVTMLVERLPEAVQRVVEGLLLFLTATVCGFVSYSSFVQAAVYQVKGATTGVIKIPYYPFAYFMAIGLTMFTIVLLIDAVTTFSKSYGNKALDELV